MRCLKCGVVMLSDRKYSRIEWTDSSQFCFGMTLQTSSEISGGHIATCVECVVFGS